MQSDCSNLRDFLNSVVGLEQKEAQKLLEIAFSHPSLCSDGAVPYTNCYERLEFLGDAVLKLVASDYLYAKFPESREGELSKIRSYIVSDEVLAKIALKLGMEQEIRISETDKSLHCNESILACAFEAMLGALYLCGKNAEIKSFFKANFSELIDDIAQNKLVTNPKAILQEYTQSKSKNLPVYKLVKETGAAHAKEFFVNVCYEGQILAQGCGKSKKAAQQEAALKACENLNLLPAKEQS